MKHSVKILCCSLCLLFHAASIRAAVIIQYHHVDTETPAATSIAPRLFAQHMAYLAENDFQVWPLPRLLAAIKHAEPLPDKVIAITFDDGYASVYHQALPILQKYQFPSTIFINTERVGGNGFMHWDELRELSARGHLIANHTVSHPHLVRALDGETAGQWEQRVSEEMRMGEVVIQRELGHSPGLLAYPYGEYNPQVQAIARELGLLAFAQHSGAFDPQVNWQAIPRFAFGGPYTALEGFIDKVNSRAMPLREVSVSDAQGQRLVEPLLPMAVTRPILTLRLQSAAVARGVSCFASGQGRLDVQVEGDTIVTRPKHDLPVGRSRINCTAPSGERGRFYWYSEFFMRKRPDGHWYAEP
ncbi:MAG: polysaccharide deacetylase family protein [Gammaproteobacteria bacterium]